MQQDMNIKFHISNLRNKKLETGRIRTEATQHKHSVEKCTRSVKEQIHQIKFVNTLSVQHHVRQMATCSTLLQHFFAANSTICVAEKRCWRDAEH